MRRPQAARAARPFRPALVWTSLALAIAGFCLALGIGSGAAGGRQVVGPPVRISPADSASCPDGSNFCVNSGPIPQLYPGAPPAKFTLTLVNSIPSTVHVTSIDATFVNQFPAGCDVRAFQFSGVSFGGTPPLAAWTLSPAVDAAAGSDGSPSTTNLNATLALRDTGQNQDACRGIHLELSFAAHGTYAAATGNTGNSGQTPSTPSTIVPTSPAAPPPTPTTPAAPPTTPAATPTTTSATTPTATTPKPPTSTTPAKPAPGTTPPSSNGPSSPGSSPGTSQPPATPPSGATPSDLLNVSISGQPGIQLVNGGVDVSGSGLKPGSAVQVFAHSSPQLIGTPQVGPDGRFNVHLPLPASLPPGDHQIVVYGTSANGQPVSQSEPFTVAPGNRLGSLGKAPPGPLATLVQFVPSQHVKTVLAITGGAVGTLGALGAALGGGTGAGGAGRGGDGGGGGRENGSDGAFLEDAELEREAMAKLGRGRGDRSRTWWWFFTRRVDHFSVHWPHRIAKVSPVLGRVVVDADYLRAMFGGLSVLLYPLGIILGILAAASVQDQAIPPSLPWFVGILALGMFDSAAGYFAGGAYALSVLFGGGILETNSVREVCGIVLTWFAVPLAAAAVRPLRRPLNPEHGLSAIWDRGADFVLSALFGGWVAAKMTEALGPLAGYEIHLSTQKWTVALFVIGFIAARMILESIAAHHYPDRLQAVAHKGDLESPALQIGISLIIQISLFIFIAAAFLKPTSWPMIAGTAVFFSVLVPWLWAERIPKSAFVAKWMPLGLAKWSFIIVGGVLLSKLLESSVHDPELLSHLGFVLLPLPLLFCWGTELFAEEEGDDEEEDEEDSSEEKADEGSVVDADVGELVMAGADAGEAERRISRNRKLSRSSGRAAEEVDQPEQEGTWHAEAEEGRFPMTWKLRLAGVPVTALCVYLVLSGIASG